MQLVRVVLAIPLMRCFDYVLPETMQVTQGCRVLVPFGRQKRIAIVVDFPTATTVENMQLKSVLACLDQQSLFSASLWKLLHWAANYYHAPLGEVLLSALPTKLRQGESAVEKTKIFWKITALGQQSLDLNQLKRAKKQQEALQAVAIEPIEVKNNGFTNTIWRQLKEKGLVEQQVEQIECFTWQQYLADTPIVRAENKLYLNKEQALAMSQLMFQQGFVAWLLEGVTGSGKTEIYLQFIEEILKKGSQVLVLVPEIGLTPQTVQRFQARFNVPIDILHSNLSDNQRLNVWQRARTGQSAVIIGTRSALFTPFLQLGLIVIDEEHDSSFKQQDGSWRYHTRDLAVVYAKQLSIPLLMGSATPSLESLYNVQQQKYRHIILKMRAGAAQRVHQHLIDLKRQRIYNGLSEQLLMRMENHLAQGNQVLLFLNRRGFAPVLLCHECGWIAQCSHCDKPYTYHQQQRVLRCHHCGGQRTIPMQCGECGSTYLLTTGLGTEQLEETLQQRFPRYRITRIDRDNVAGKGKLEQHLSDIQQGRSQILIGTQMLAKGHHFPDVTLVALVNVDSALFSVDFRAEERLAQLYVQVAGRAGRANKQGEVLLQTHYPEHPLLQSLLQQGYAGFAKQALVLRQQMGLPPFSAQALFKAQSRDSDAAEQFLYRLAEYLASKKLVGLYILGPLPAPHSKKAGQFRWQLLLQHQSKVELQQALCWLQQYDFAFATKVRWILDIDPLELG